MIRMIPNLTNPIDFKGKYLMDSISFVLFVFLFFFFLTKNEYLLNFRSLTNQEEAIKIEREGVKQE